MRTITDTIGQTPLIRLQYLSPQIALKLERTNPAGSVKDRPAYHIIATAERVGWLRPGGTIIESSSGNFGISLAMLGAARGYRVLILVDPKTTPANLALMRAYGAEVIVVTEQDDTGSYHKTRIAEANRLARQIPGAFRPDQCFNLLNSEAHLLGTAAEIVADCGGPPAAVVAAVSTGGQLGGLARFFKRHAPRTLIVGVDAVGSGIFGGPSHAYLMPGVGLGWTPDNLDLALLDRVFNVPDDDAFAACRTLARHEGVLVGPSSGAVLLGALHIAARLGPSALVVGMVADSGERYLHSVYDDAWMAERGFACTLTPEQLHQRARSLEPTPERRGQPASSALRRQLAIPPSTVALSALRGEAPAQERAAHQSQRGYDIYC